MFTLEETPNSRKTTLEPPTYTTEWVASGEFNDVIVRAYVYGGTPQFVIVDGNVLYRQDVKIDPNGFAQYIVTVPYAKRNRTPGQVGTYTFDFDTTGATINRKAAKEHVASYPDNGDWHKGAVGVNGNDVQGADIVVPALKYNIRFRHPQGAVSIPYTKQLARNTGKTNANTFLTFDPGELLFIGATGSDGSDSEAEVGYQIVASANETDLSIGEIISIAKKGHEYLWIEFEDAVQDGEATKPPKRVHIERMYDPVDFASVFGWSA